MLRQRVTLVTYGAQCHSIDVTNSISDIRFSTENHHGNLLLEPVIKRATGTSFPIQYCK